MEVVSLSAPVGECVNTSSPMQTSSFEIEYEPVECDNDGDIFGGQLRGKVGQARRERIRATMP